MRLHHHPLSSNARRVTLTIHQLGIADRVEIVPVNLAKGEQRSPAHLRLNPNGRVPVLEDEDLVLWESHAIMQYLAEKTPRQTLYPTSTTALGERADVNRWMFWNAQHFTPAIAILNYERMIKRFLGAGDPDPVEVARGEKLFTQFASVLDDHLARNEWLALGRLTLADLAVAASLMSTASASLPVEGLDHLLAWYGRLQELEAWRQTSP